MPAICWECGEAGHVAGDCPNKALASDNGKPPWCGICDERTRLIGLDVVSRCQACHPLARKLLKQFRRCPHCHALVYEWDSSPDCASHKMPDAPDRRPEREHIREITRSAA